MSVWCKCPPGTPARLVVDKAFCNTCDDPVKPRSASFSILAYKRDDPHDSADDLRRTGLPMCRLERTVRWALGKGCDTLLIELGDPVAESGVTHHLCADPACPGGC